MRFSGFDIWTIKYIRTINLYKWLTHKFLYHSPSYLQYLASDLIRSNTAFVVLNTYSIAMVLSMNFIDSSRDASEGLRFQLMVKT